MIELIGMAILVIASGFFSGSETALFSLTQDEVRNFRLGPRRQRAVSRLLADPDRLLTAILFCNLLINLLFFALSIVVANRLAGDSSPMVAGLFSLGSLLGVIVLGEVIPKNIAVMFPRVISQIVAFPLTLVTRLVDPVIPFFKSLSRALRRAFWPNLQRETVLDTEDLERAVEGSALSEELRYQEREILGRILELSEITAEEVMRPRGTYMPQAAPVALVDLHQQVPPSGCVVVSAGESGAAERVIPLSEMSSIPEADLQSSAVETVPVAWCAPVSLVVRELRAAPLSVASVVDEYGDAIGIITWRDILETIILPEPSRTRRVLLREPVREVGTDEYEVEGLTTLRYLCQRLGMDHIPDEEGITTVAGVLQEDLDRIPKVDDYCAWRGWKFTVTAADKRGHLKALVTRLSEDGADE